MSNIDPKTLESKTLKCKTLECKLTMDIQVIQRSNVVEEAFVSLYDKFKDEFGYDDEYELNRYKTIMHYVEKPSLDDMDLVPKAVKDFYYSLISKNELTDTFITRPVTCGNDHRLVCYRELLDSKYYLWYEWQKVKVHCDNIQALKQCIQFSIK